MERTTIGEALMPINFEENILRMLKLSKRTHIPEISEWNHIGITEEEAKVIAYKNKLSLRILTSSFLPTLRVFVLSPSSPQPKTSTVSFNDTMQKGGE